MLSKQRPKVQEGKGYVQWEEAKVGKREAVESKDGHGKKEAWNSKQLMWYLLTLMGTTNLNPKDQDKKGIWPNPFNISRYNISWKKLWCEDSIH